LSIARDGGTLSLSVDLLSDPGVVRWRDLDAAYLVFTTVLAGRGSSVTAFDAQTAGIEFEEARDGAIIRANWGEFGLQGGASVETVNAQDRRYVATLGGRPVPLQRLTEERLSG
jgi:hypothetical protein